MTPYYEEKGIVIYHGDCREILPDLPKVDVVLTDPPYPNKAEHFIEEIKTAIVFFQTFQCPRWFVFWDEMSKPPISSLLVAIHIWHRSNTNRPDNYEPIYEFNIDGEKQASRCFPAPVIYPGLTGCYEATGHPTQKNQKMIMIMIEKCKIKGTILDPFMGSGTTGIACIQTGLDFIGIELEEKYCEIAAKRLNVFKYAEQHPEKEKKGFFE